MKWNETKWMRWLWRNGGINFCVRGKRKKPEKYIIHSRFVHYETHMEWPRRELAAPAVVREHLTACSTTVLLKGMSSTANSRAQAAFLLMMDRYGSFPLLSVPSRFSIWTYLKISEKILGAPAWRWREWIWLTWAIRQVKWVKWLFTLVFNRNSKLRICILCY